MQIKVIYVSVHLLHNRHFVIPHKVLNGLLGQAKDKSIPLKIPEH